MKRKQLGYIDLSGAFTAMIVVSAIIGAAVMGICVWLFPWLWGVVKPLLHAVTA